MNLFQQICSLPNLEAAFARVQQNGGCRGSDGVSIRRFAGNLTGNLRKLSDALHYQRYHPFPLMRFAIPKPAGGQRFLSVPTVRDRIAQTAVFLIIKDIFEAEFETNSHPIDRGAALQPPFTTLNIGAIKVIVTQSTPMSTLTSTTCHTTCCLKK